MIAPRQEKFWPASHDVWRWHQSALVLLKKRSIRLRLAVECVIAITPHLRNFGGITGVMHESIDQRIGIKGNVGSHFRAVVLHTSDRGPVPASTSIRNDYDPTHHREHGFRA